MKRIVFLIALLLCLAAHTAHAAPFACPRYAPKIIVNIDLTEPTIDFSMDKKTLDQKFAAIKMPSPQIYHLEINSVMTGPMQAIHKADLHQTTDPKTGATCLNINSITVFLRMRPLIYMSSEFQKSECKYKAFLQHEMKHIAVDKEIMDAYAPRIKSGLEFAFNGDAGSMIGPIPLNDITKSKLSLEDSINGAVQNLFNLMMEDRLERQHEVDGAGEYANLSNAC